MSVETQESLNNTVGNESNCVHCDHEHASYWYLFERLFTIMEFFFLQTKMLFK